MKKAVKFMLAPLLVLAMFTTTFASSPSIVVSNERLPVKAVSKDNRVMVPLRAIFESLDATVNYDSATKTITGDQNGKIIILKIDDKVATVDGKQVTLDVPATAIDGVTLVPVRFIGESLGAEVGWANNTVLINSDKDMPISDGEWLYYKLQNPETWAETLYRVRLDGSGNEKIFEADGELMFWTLEGDKIIYVTEPDYYKIYEEKGPDMDPMWENNVVNAIFSMNKDGTDKKSIIKGDIFNIHDSTIERLVENGAGIYDIGDSTKDRLLDDEGEHILHWYNIISIDDGWIYFQTYTETYDEQTSYIKEHLSKVRLDGTGLTVISKKGVGGGIIKVVDEWAYFECTDFGGHFQNIVRQNFKTGEVGVLTQNACILGMHSDIIYFYKGDKEGVYSININTLEEKYITSTGDDRDAWYTMNDGNIYSIDLFDRSSEDVLIHKLDITSEEKRELERLGHNSYEIEEDGYLYLVNYEEIYKSYDLVSSISELYKKDLKTGDKTLLLSAEGPIIHLTMDDGQDNRRGHYRD